MLIPTALILATLSTTLHLSNAAPLKEDLLQIPHHSVLPRYPVERRATRNEYATWASAAIKQMFTTWYNPSSGLFGKAWWNSANVITTLADFVEHFPHFDSGVEFLTNIAFPNTLANAPAAAGFPGFINDYYDDELWWVLAWIKVYDVTGDRRYLTAAAQIFEDSKKSFGTSSCGALWWDKAHSGTNSVENELYLTAAAKLANRLPNTPSGSYYYNEAIKAYKWFINSGLINSNNLINDHLNKACKNDLTTPVFTYNQGIILSGLTEIAWSAGKNAHIYNDLANTLALAGIKHFTDANGILHEKLCEPNCSPDLQQFKGVFGRNIQFMVDRATNLSAENRAIYVKFLQVNADSVWKTNQVNNKLGLVWSGPIGKFSIQTQSSALDIIVGAACVS